MEGYASHKPSKEHHGDWTNADMEERLAAKKPRVTASEGLTDAGGERQAETAMECQTACETNSEDEMDNKLQNQGETSNLDEMMPDDVQQTRARGESDADNEVKRNIEQKEEDEVQAEREEASSHQPGGEEGTERHETMKSEMSNRETNHDINMIAGAQWATLSKIPSSGDKDENMLTDEEDTRKDEGEDTGLEKVRGHEGNISKTDHDDNPQMGHSEEDEEERGIDMKKKTPGLDIGRELVKTDISVRETSHERNMMTGNDWATPCEVQSSGDEKKLSLYGDATYSSMPQTNTSEMKDDTFPNLGKKMYDYGEPCLDEEKRTYKWTQRAPQPHYGLYNQGATCYLNSVLQVLSMTPEIHDRLDSTLSTDQELGKIFEGLKENTCGTEDIARSLEIENVCEQRDAAECLELILQKIVPQASKVFHGELTYMTQCSNGHVINEESNHFWTLPLSLKDVHDETYSVEESLERFFQTKTITGSSKVYCNGCDDDAEATSGCEMVECPHILTLLLKRFDYDYYTMSYVKSGCSVDVPLLLRLKNKMYKLYGMVNHAGSLRGGHYTATILSSKDNAWYEFDDVHVDKVIDQPFAKSMTYNSRTVYLLMYRAGKFLMPCETNSEPCCWLMANECQKSNETDQSGDEVSLLHQPTEEDPKSKKFYALSFLVVFCCMLWLAAVICATVTLKIL